MTSINTTFTDDDDDGYQLNYIAIGYAQTPIFILTILFAIFYTILIFLRPTFRQNKLNWFTANICLTNALFCIIMLSLDIQILTGRFTGISCRFQTFLIFSSVCQLMSAHCVAAMCRFLAIVYATKHLFRSMKFSLSSIIAGWFIGFLTAFPFIFYDGFICGNTTQNSVLSFYTMIIVFIFPILFIGISNVKILIYVHRSSRQVHDGNGLNRASHARDIHLMKVLIGTFLIFAFGWAPAFGLQAFADSLTIPPFIDGISQMLPPFAMFFDVIILIFTNQPVRGFIKENLLKPFRRPIGQTIQPTNIAKVRQF